MNAHLYFGIKLLHIAAASLWLGGPPVAAFGLRRALGGAPAAASAHVARLIAVTPLFVASALITVATGGVLIWLAGGLGEAPTRILLGAVLVAPIFVLGGAMARPALQRLERHFGAGGDASSAEQDVRRFLFAHRAEQALRLTVLGLMVVPW